MEYLLELRKRLLWCCCGALLVFCLLSFFANPLYQFLASPLLAQLPQGQSLIATQVPATFLIPIKFVFMVTLLLVMPYFLYHLWSFVAPALYTRERKIVWLLLTPSIFLFYLGVLFCYAIVFPALFHFFVSTTPAHVQLWPDIGLYLDFSLHLLMAFGIAFEVPILVLALVGFNIFTLEDLRAARPYVIVLAFIVAMFLTPPDVLSQTFLAIPLWLLYEAGLLFARYLPAFTPGLDDRE